ncbi:hypothetical protein [Pseudogulbenkiania subflava]|uniref:Uncharacterized protein n=1 Tax=Pseudogulbenkiania subflava DSM 22618 TaxID=1123014 RepID=A0A1Y6BQB2_9NEIS|nr:hypothetical protein [Pseudogulbenkiania subflava]SMF23470.1 hypothetical protein SAMN02745746_02053 [Pseudogulbenkiania subflava DSM 22618]SMF32881.1 hypothetical protein SAMN02745746_02601 [Pseudogulbenkiania subflava DSM 22618]SMF47852.1 hypothetical protein SAMN02745746_03530 [Pseudogulbenkiania subflava DSM 22618]
MTSKSLPIEVTESLRVTGGRQGEHWTVRLNALCHQMNLPYWIVRERPEEIELVVQGSLTKIEELGQEILDGALGFTPKSVSLQKQQSFLYFLRRKPDAT